MRLATLHGDSQSRGRIHACNRSSFARRFQGCKNGADHTCQHILEFFWHPLGQHLKGGSQADSGMWAFRVVPVQVVPHGAVEGSEVGEQQVLWSETSSSCKVRLKRSTQAFIFGVFGHVQRCLMSRSWSEFLKRAMEFATVIGEHVFDFERGLLKERRLQELGGGFAPGGGDGRGEGQTRVQVNGGEDVAAAPSVLLHDRVQGDAMAGMRGFKVFGLARLVADGRVCPRDLAVEMGAFQWVVLDHVRNGSGAREWQLMLLAKGLHQHVDLVLSEPGVLIAQYANELDDPLIPFAFAGHLGTSASVFQGKLAAFPKTLSPV